MLGSLCCGPHGHAPEPEHWWGSTGSRIEKQASQWTLKSETCVVGPGRFWKVFLCPKGTWPLGAILGLFLTSGPLTFGKETGLAGKVAAGCVLLRPDTGGQAWEPARPPSFSALPVHHLSPRFRRNELGAEKEERAPLGTQRGWKDHLLVFTGRGAGGGAAGGRGCVLRGGLCNEGVFEAAGGQYGLPTGMFSRSLPL